MARDELLDVLDQFAYRAKRTTADGALGNEPEPALDLVEPRTVRGREVQVVARAPGNPGAHLGVFMGGVVIEDQMHIEVFRHVAVHMIQERQKLLVPVARFALPDHWSGPRL